MRLFSAISSVLVIPLRREYVKEMMVVLWLSGRGAGDYRVSQEKYISASIKATDQILFLWAPCISQL